MADVCSPSPSPKSSFQSLRRSTSQRSFRHPSTSTRQHNAAPSPTQRIQTAAAAHSPRVVARQSTVDTGTQYTPPGFPPTASQSTAAVSLALPAESPGDPQDEAMSSSGPPSSLEPPSEPNVRCDPEPHTPPTQASGNASEAGVREESPAKRVKSDGVGTVEMPLDYMNCDVRKLGYIISSMLMKLVHINDPSFKNSTLTRFHSRAPPGISVKDYLDRLIVHATLPPPILLSMVYLLDRLCVSYPIFTISSLTVHRFLIASATVAAKGLSDSFWTNNTYARVGGISVKELALLELDFLQRVDWRIIPNPKVLNDYYMSLVMQTEGYSLEGQNDAAAGT